MIIRYHTYCRVDLGQTWRWRGCFSRARDLRQGAWWCSTFEHFLSNFKWKMTTFPERSPLQCYHKPANMRGPPALRRWCFIVLCLTRIWELVLLFRCSANDDACLVSYMMHEDGKRVSCLTESWGWHLQLALLNKLLHFRQILHSSEMHQHNRRSRMVQQQQWFSLVKKQKRGRMQGWLVIFARNIQSKCV